MSNPSEGRRKSKIDICILGKCRSASRRTRTRRENEDPSYFCLIGEGERFTHECKSPTTRPTHRPCPCEVGSEDRVRDRDLIFGLEYGHSWMLRTFHKKRRSWSHRISSIVVQSCFHRSLCDECVSVCELLRFSDSHNTSLRKKPPDTLGNIFFVCFFENTPIRITHLRLMSEKCFNFFEEQLFLEKKQFSKNSEEIYIIELFLMMYRVLWSGNR